MAGGCFRMQRQILLPDGFPSKFRRLVKRLTPADHDIALTKGLQKLKPDPAVYFSPIQKGGMRYVNQKII
jgi:hypothetical protein